VTALTSAKNEFQRCTSLQVSRWPPASQPPRTCSPLPGLRRCARRVRAQWHRSLLRCESTCQGPAAHARSLTRTTMTIASSRRMQGGGEGAPPNRSMSSSLIASMLITRTLKQQRGHFFSSVHSANGLRYLCVRTCFGAAVKRLAQLGGRAHELPAERCRLSPAPALRGPTAPRSPRSLLVLDRASSTPHAPGGAGVRRPPSRAL
jgi:hypothetical protein